MLAELGITDETLKRFACERMKNRLENNVVDVSKKKLKALAKFIDVDEPSDILRSQY
jgi:hypothetical protein